jgi:hypothetical protein
LLSCSVDVSQDKTDDVIGFEDLDSIWPWSWLLDESDMTQLNGISAKLAHKVKYNQGGEKSSASASSKPSSSSAALDDKKQHSSLTSEVMALFM